MKEWIKKLKQKRLNKKIEKALTFLARYTNIADLKGKSVIRYNGDDFKIKLIEVQKSYSTANPVISITIKGG